MSEIPDDILRAAQRAVDIAGEITQENVAYEFVVQAALAILAERERCADIAHGLNGWGPVGGHKVAEHIAKVIEKGR